MSEFSMDELTAIAKKADEACIENDKKDDIYFAWAYARLAGAADSLHAMIWRRNSSIDSKDKKCNT